MEKFVGDFCTWTKNELKEWLVPCREGSFFPEHTYSESFVRCPFCGKKIDACSEIDGPGLTDLQTQVLEYLILYIDTWGFPPTLGEIMGRPRGGPRRSRKDTHLILEALDKGGYIYRIGEKNGDRRFIGRAVRGIAPLKFPDGSPAKVRVTHDRTASTVKFSAKGERVKNEG